MGPQHLFSSSVCSFTFSVNLWMSLMCIFTPAENQDTISRLCCSTSHPKTLWNICKFSPNSFWNPLRTNPSAHSDPPASRATALLLCVWTHRGSNLTLIFLFMPWALCLHHINTKTALCVCVCVFLSQLHTHLLFIVLQEKCEDTKENQLFYWSDCLVYW